MNEIEQKAVRKDGDVTMCDLLNKEIEELTNQKEIEEMAKVICQQQYFNTHCVEHCNLKGYCCECTDLATNLYNAGYRNCKDKVVLSKEEWARLRNLEINYDDTYEHYREYSNENKKLKAENERLIIELKARANINVDDFDEMQTLRRATFELKAENERLKHLREVDNTTMITLRKSNTELNECMDEMQDRIAELEKENETKTDTITDLLKKQEFYEKEKLKQFAEKLKEKCEYNRKEYCCEATVSARDIDETLKEFLL